MLWHHTVYPSRLVSRLHMNDYRTASLTLLSSLTTWLSHSKKKTCDVCKHPYSFTKGEYSFARCVELTYTIVSLSLCSWYALHASSTSPVSASSSAGFICHPFWSAGYYGWNRLACRATVDHHLDMESLFHHGRVNVSHTTSVRP